MQKRQNTVNIGNIQRKKSSRVSSGGCVTILVVFTAIKNKNEYHVSIFGGLS